MMMSNSLFEVQIVLPGTCKEAFWIMHMQSQQGLSLQPVIQADAQITSVLTMAISGRDGWGAFTASLSSMSQQKSGEKSNDEIIDIFWKEFKHFAYRMGSYGHQLSWFENDGTLFGQYYLWHEIHPIPFTEFLGFIACQTNSKHLGIGSAERSWSNVKTIKNGKQENINHWKCGPFYTHLLILRRFRYWEVWMQHMILILICLATWFEVRKVFHRFLSKCIFCLLPTHLRGYAMGQKGTGMFR